MSGKKGSKETSMSIPPWLEQSLKPFITNSVNMNNSMGKAAWDWGMSNNPHYGAGNSTGAPNTNQPPVQTVEDVYKYPGETIPGNRE